MADRNAQKEALFIPMSVFALGNQQTIDEVAQGLVIPAQKYNTKVFVVYGDKNSKTLAQKISKLAGMDGIVRSPTTDRRSKINDYNDMVRSVGVEPENALVLATGLTRDAINEVPAVPVNIRSHIPATGKFSSMLESNSNSLTASNMRQFDIILNVVKASILEPA